MRNQEQQRFIAPADNTRPFKSHRYDVFGVKIGRRLTIFGDQALSAFIAFEGDPSVLAYCERPIVIKDLKPRRVVDFWVKRASGEELWFLLRPTERTWRSDPTAPTAAFNAWAEAKGLSIVLHVPEELGLTGEARRNWGEILRYLCANARFVQAELAERIYLTCGDARTIGEVQNLMADEDPILVRTAIFRLVHEGRIQIPTIDTSAIGLDTLVVSK